MKQSAKPLRVPVQSFSFNAWKELEKPNPPPTDFAEQQALKVEALAKTAATNHGLETATHYTNEAALWRNKITILNDELADTNAKIAFQALNILLIQTTAGSKLALEAIRQLVNHAHSSLNALASNNHTDAASVMLGSLIDATNEFNALAYRRPDLFVDEAKGAFGIPGLISPFLQKTKANAELVDKLKVGRDCTIQLPTKASGQGNQMNLETPANLWAYRLWRYITWVQDQAAIFARQPPDYQQQLVEAHPNSLSWMEAAVALKPFSRGSFDDWKPVIWQVTMDATNGKPEDEPELNKFKSKPAVYESPNSYRTLATTPKAYRKEIKEALERGLEALVRQQEKALRVNAKAK